VGPFGAEPGNLYSVLLWLAMFSRLLTSFALFRAFFLTFHNNSRDGSPSTRRAEWNAAETSAALRWPLLLSSGAAVVIGLAVVGSADWFNRFLSRALTVKAASADVDPFLIGFSGLLGLLGIVVAWMMYSQSSTWPQRIFDALGPFSRLSRHRFYLEDCCLWCVILPTRGLAQLCRFFDRFVVDGLLASFPERIPARLSKVAKSLQNEHVQFYATSLVLAAAVLLVVLLWLEG
jgi:NADH:ubiquinone oxidoreductase subunit 5 (subunit L)/multisubunit Na+/H+ antiporter MnhA subunit